MAGDDGMSLDELLRRLEMQERQQEQQQEETRKPPQAQPQPPQQPDEGELQRLRIVEAQRVEIERLKRALQDAEQQKSSSLNLDLTAPTDNSKPPKQNETKNTKNNKSNKKGANNTTTTTSNKDDQEQNNSDEEIERLKAEIEKERKRQEVERLRSQLAQLKSQNNGNNTNNNSGNKNNHNNKNNNNNNESNFHTTTTTEQDRIMAEIESLKSKLSNIGPAEKNSTQSRIDELLRQKATLQNELSSLKSSPSKPDSREQKFAELERRKLELQRELSSGPSKTELVSQHEQQKKELAEIQFGVDVCFFMDCTGSMIAFLKAAKKNIRNIVEKVKHIDSRAILRFSFVGYRDYGDATMFEQLDFISVYNINAFEKKLASVAAYGGGDGPENVAGGLEICTRLSWKASTRLLIHIADAPCHGKKYHNLRDDAYPNGDPNGLDPEQLLKKLIGLQVDYYFLRMTRYTDLMTTIFKKVYEQGRRPFEQHPVASDPANFLPKVVASIHSSMAKSVAFRQ